MRALLLQIDMGLRLHFRNPMAVVYSYLFPTIFLVAFWTLYRYDQVPLVRHMGELLTITALGGACFGLPTTLVSDRERGVWRRYRLAPVRLAAVVGATLAARYVLLLIAALLQMTLARLVGMPMPNHPIELAVAFTAVAFALMGLGLTIAALADNVPAVQALGQCIFLPMLILGGVAVPLASLPPWAERLSAFFPGRYAVDAISATVTGAGLRDARGSLAALVLIGAAAIVAGARMFRWDCGQRFRTLPGKSWIVVALASWALVGVAAQPELGAPPARSAGRAPASSSQPASSPQVSSSPQAAPSPQSMTQAPAPPTQPKPSTQPLPSPNAGGGSVPPASPAPEVDARGRAETAPAAPARAATAAAPSDRPAEAPAAAPDRAPGDAPPAADRSAAPPAPESRGATAPAPAGPNSSASARDGAAQPGAPWRSVTRAQIDADIDFTHLPPDLGIVTPIAPDDEMPGDDVAPLLEAIEARLPDWPAGRVADPVQRVRNLLTILAVPDVQQDPIERYLPAVVFRHVRTTMPESELVQVLYWMAMHPYAGDDLPGEALVELGFTRTDANPEDVRNRAAIYGVKLLGRLLGHL